MEAHESLERFEKAHEQTHGHGDEGGGGLSRHAALSVAVIAAFLAIATFLGNEAVKEAIQGQTKVSDANAQKSTFDTQDEILQFGRLTLAVFQRGNDPGFKEAAKTGSKELDKIAKQVPAEQKRLEEVVSENRKEVSHANDQHLLYELAEVLLQIGIVLASVAIIARRRFLLFGSQAVAVVGVVILVLGYLK
jgi:hypothetical protein